MSDLIERLSRINDPSLYDELCLAMEADGDPTLGAARASSLRKARRCFEAVMAAMREPSEERSRVRLEAWRSTTPHRRASDWLAAVAAADLDAFEREHGLAERPPAAAPAPPSA